MTGKELQNWTETCLDELEKKQGNLKKEFALGEQDSYHLNREDGILIFEQEGNPSCSFKAVPIGSLVPERENWMWAWANASLTPSMRKAAEELKGLRDETGFGIFEIESFKADRTLAQELSALSVHYLGARGLYRVITDQTVLYLALFSKTQDPA